MTGLLQIRNRQRARAVDLRLLRKITRHLLAEEFHAAQCELCLHLVNAEEMACLNEAFLQHEGSTDVITFDHSDQLKHQTPNTKHQLCGEIFISLDDAIMQAREFRTSWQSELIRYVIHGLLHLVGHDDLKSAARKKMKREENRLLRAMEDKFKIAGLKLKPTRSKNPPTRPPLPTEN